MEAEPESAASSSTHKELACTRDSLPTSLPAISAPLFQGESSSPRPLDSCGAGHPTRPSRHAQLVGSQVRWRVPKGSPPGSAAQARCVEVGCCGLQGATRAGALPCPTMRARQVLSISRDKQQQRLLASRQGRLGEQRLTHRSEALTLLIRFHDVLDLFGAENFPAEAAWSAFIEAAISQAAPSSCVPQHPTVLDPQCSSWATVRWQSHKSPPFVMHTCQHTPGAMPYTHLFLVSSLYLGEVSSLWSPAPMSARAFATAAETRPAAGLGLLRACVKEDEEPIIFPFPCATQESKDAPPSTSFIRLVSWSACSQPPLHPHPPWHHPVM